MEEPASEAAKESLVRGGVAKDDALCVSHAMLDDFPRVHKPRDVASLRVALVGDGRMLDENGRKNGTPLKRNTHAHTAAAATSERTGARGDK